MGYLVLIFSLGESLAKFCIMTKDPWYPSTNMGGCKSTAAKIRRLANRDCFPLFCNALRRHLDTFGGTRPVTSYIVTLWCPFSTSDSFSVTHEESMTILPNSSASFSWFFSWLLVVSCFCRMCLINLIFVSLLSAVFGLSGDGWNASNRSARFSAGWGGSWSTRRGDHLDGQGWQGGKSMERDVLKSFKIYM